AWIVPSPSPAQPTPVLPRRTGGRHWRQGRFTKAPIFPVATWASRRRGQLLYGAAVASARLVLPGRAPGPARGGRKTKGPAPGRPFARTPKAIAYSRCATPARSSSSSARVLSIAARLNASTGRSATRVYSPLAVVTGTPYI